MIPLLVPAAVAAQLQVTEKTLANWRALNQGPAFIKVGGRVRYEPDALAAYRASLVPRSNVTHIQSARSA